MATKRTFKVTLIPARPERGFICSRFSFGETLPSKTFDATSLDEVETVVRDFATEYRNGCQASVDVVVGRKPPGFDARMQQLRYFNLDSTEDAA